MNHQFIRRIWSERIVLDGENGEDYVGENYVGQNGQE